MPYYAVAFSLILSLLNTHNQIHDRLLTFPSGLGFGSYQCGPQLMNSTVCKYGACWSGQDFFSALHAVQVGYGDWKCSAYTCLFIGPGQIWPLLVTSSSSWLQTAGRRQGAQFYLEVFNRIDVPSWTDKCDRPCREHPWGHGACCRCGSLSSLWFAIGILLFNLIVNWKYQKTQHG